VERAQPRLEAVQGGGSGYDLRQSVPQPDRWRDEGVPVCVGAAEWQQVPSRWSSGGKNHGVVVGRAFNVDQVVDSSVHKHKLGICSALLE